MADNLYDAAAMQALDAWAIEEQGVSGLALMEEAGWALADAVLRGWPRDPVVVICGGGNNAGDGYVAARHLRDRGRAVRILHTADPETLKGDARRAFDLVKGSAPEPFQGGRLDGAGVIIDALLGTGFVGVPRGEVASAIAAINASGTPVVSADSPSGVNASTGEVPGDAVRASLTVTFAANKLGLHVAPGKLHAGSVQVARLPYPAGWPVVPCGRLLGAGAAGRVPSRDAASTKFTSGHVLVAGGSMGLSGAPTMAAGAAMRAGAGYVSVAAPSEVARVIDSHLMEAMTVQLSGPSGHHSADNAPVVAGLLERRGGALVLGPGLGGGAEQQAFALALLSVPAPLLIDADGLGAIRDGLSAIAQRTAPTVLTPHSGELARLLDRDSAEVDAKRVESVRLLAASTRATVVLKGDDTLVCHDPGAPLLVGQGRAPGLATAGTGDVLAGVIGTYLAQGLSAAEASAAGVVVHSEAGRIAARRVGTADGVVAGDVIEALPAALSSTRAAA